MRVGGGEWMQEAHVAEDVEVLLARTLAEATAAFSCLAMSITDAFFLSSAGFCIVAALGFAAALLPDSFDNRVRRIMQPRGSS